MAGKRTREATTDVAAAAAAPSRSPMEESADALAGVDGAFMTGVKRKGTGGTSPPKKKSATTVGRPRSNSIDRLVDVAGSLLTEDIPDRKGGVSAPCSATAVAAAAAAAAAGASVPNPMAVAALAKLPPVVVPTGFRKKGSGGPTSKAATAAAAAAAAASAAESDGEDGDLQDSKKTQITYNPDIPMTKEQLTSWRREMRRVRNRESAAASRRKVRDRIEELEEEVDVWKKRYQEVMGRLGQADGGKNKKQRRNGKRDEGQGGGGKGEEVFKL